MRFLVLIGIFLALVSYPQKNLEGEIFIDPNHTYHLTTAEVAEDMNWTRPKRGYLFGQPIYFSTIEKQALLDLPGVGPSLAAKLLQLHRQNPNPSWADIDAVKGVGPAKLRLLKKHLILD